MRWLKSYGFWRSVAIIVSAVPIAIFTNALRVSGTGVLAHYYGTEVADGFFHSFSGWVIYIVAFLMLFGVGWIMDRFKPAPRGARPGGKKLDPDERSDVVRTSVTPAPVIPVEGAE
jgi:exosortase/archaeosortase family protein